MSILKLTKKDITKNGEKEDNKIKLKKSDLSYDSAMVHGWEQSNRESLEILNTYNDKINKNEWLTEDDRKAYRSALDSYISTSNQLRGINNNLGEGYSEEDELKWTDSISSMNKGYDEITSYYSQFKSDEHFNNWLNDQRLQKEFKATLEAEDFDHYSQLGAQIQNPEYEKATLDKMNLWERLLGEDINNPVTFGRENIDKLEERIAYSNNSAEMGPAHQYYRYKHLEDDEVAIYNYYLGKGETEKAEEYLKSLEDTINQREAEQIIANIDTSKLLSLHFAVGAGLDQYVSGVLNLDNLIKGTEADPTSSIQYASTTIRENLGDSFWGGAYDTISATTNMLPSILVASIAGPTAGKVAMGASIAGNSYAEMKKLGYNEWQARGYAAMVTASEIGLQSFLGGIGALGGKYSLSAATTKLVSGFDHALAKLAINVPLKMGSEALEEAFQTALEPAFKALATGEEFEPAEWEDIFYSGLIGALTSGLTDGIPSIKGGIKAAIQAKKYKNIYGEGSQALVSEALDIDPENAHAQKMQTKLNKRKDLSGYNIQHLVESNENALREQDKEKIKKVAEERLAKYGESGDISSIAEVIAKIRSGEDITRAERNILVDSEFGRRVSTELNPDIIKSGDYTTDWVGNIGTERINPEVYNRELYELAKQKAGIDEAAEKASVAKTIDESETASGTNLKVPESGKTIVNGEKTSKSDNEKLVEAIATDKVSRVEGFSNEAATAMIKGYDGSISPTQYTMSFDDAFKMGVNGVPSSKLTRVINSGLSERVAFTAYELGRKSSEKGEAVLNSLSNNGIINTNESEAGNESGESVHIRNSSKRNGGKNTERQISRVEGGTRQAESRGKTPRIADSEAARLVNEGREVKVANLGILGGSVEQTVRLVDKENETSSMKKARKRAEARGLKVTFFVGDNLVIKDKNGEWFSARAYIKGKHVLVRADHSLYTADQLMRHELGHDMIAKGEVDIEAVRERLEDKVGKENIDKLAEFYTDAYEGSGMSAEEIWEECICDSLGDMNIFSDVADKTVFMEGMISEIKAATSETKSPTQTRGSPEGKASMDFNLSDEDYRNYGWVRDNNVISAGHWKTFTTNFADAVARDYYFNKTPDGEFMIEAYNYYDSLSPADVIVFAQGTIESPIVTRIIKINSTDSDTIEEARRDIYAFERRGLYSKAGKLLNIHTPVNSGRVSNGRGNGYQNARNNNELGVKRSRSEITANPVIKSEVNEDEGTVTVTYKNGDVVTEPWGNGKASRELDTDSTEYKINTSMTMAEAKRMIESAYKVNGIAEYYEGEYTDAEDWLRKAGSDEVEMYIENDYDLQAKYINSNEDILNEEYRISDVLDAYLAGTLVGKEKPKAKRLDVSQSTRLKDSRFYSPQKIEDAQKTFELASKKAVGKDAAAINRARAEILLFAHNKGAAELLGVTQSELNKKLRSWSNYSATAKNISERINAGVAEENRWTGIENSSYINKAKVTNEDIERLVASVEGDSKGYERKYIARVMLAADTHIDYSGLKFKFASSQQVNQDNNSGGRVLGFYDDTNRLIEVTHDKPNTVAHEMGHYIDAQWGRDLIGTNSSHLFLTTGVNEDLVRERYGENGVQFLKNFKIFINSLSDVNNNRDSYTNDRKEIFARFFAKFVEWTDNIATGNRYYSYESSMYNDKFTQAQYIEFARLLQEKALLDGTIKENRQHGKASRELDTEYLDAVNRGDMETAQRMVDEAAKEAGYTIKAYHGSRKVFNEFDDSKKGSNTHTETSKRWFFAADEKTANSYYPYGTLKELQKQHPEWTWANPEKLKEKGKLYSLFLKFDNPLVVDVADYDYASHQEKADAWMEYVEQAEANGNDGIILLNAMDNQLNPSARESTVYMFRDSSQAKLADAVVRDDNNNVIPLSERFNSKNSDIRYSRELDLIDFINENPDGEASKPLTNREILANALETTAQNDTERENLKRYKQKIDLINSEEKKLHDIRAQIKELSFKKGARDTEAIRNLQFEANQAANRINTYDKQLLNLESTKALRGVLEREKALARKRDAQKFKEAQDRYREKAAKSHREIMTRYQESRKRATESRNKTAMRHKIKGIVSELNTLLLKPTAKKHIKEELRKEVADALSAINMDTVAADERVAMYNALIAKENNPDVIAELTKTRDRIQLQGETLKEKLDALQSAYEKIENTDDIELNLAYQEVIRNSIKNVSEKVGKTSIRNMTLEQLEMVYDLFTMIRHTIRDANNAFKTKKGETIMQMAEAVNDQVRTVGGQPYKRNAISANLQRIGWTFLKPYVAFRTIGSVTLTNMYKELRSGEDVFYGDVRAAQAFIENQYEKHGYKSWDMKKTKTFTAKSGKTFDLTLEQMMSLYAYSRREQAHDHIIEGGIVFEDALIVEKNKAGIPIKYEVTTKDAFNLSEETFVEIANSLTAEQKAFVDEMQTYLSDTMGEKGNEVSMQLLGVKLFKEKFYLPIKSSQYYMNFKAEEAGEIKLKSPSFSKETVQHANNPIVIHNFTDLWAEHINDMSMYHSFVLALEDFTRVYNYKTKTDATVETMDTKATLETAYPGVTKYINKFLKDMNGGVRNETVGWAEKLTSLAKKGSVLGSLSVAIQQPSAVMRAMAYINPKYFVTTMHKSVNLVKHKQDWAELKRYAPIAGIKEMGRFDVGMGQATKDWIQSNKTLMEKGEDILSAGPAFMDEVAWVSIWNAVKRETAHNNPNITKSYDEFLKLAGERFAEVISLSQVYDSVFSRSDLMRNKSWIAKSLTAFMAEPSTTLNMIWDSWVQAKRSGSVKGYVKAITTTGAPIVAATVLNSALKSIILALRDDDEDESYVEKYLEHFVGDLKDSLNPLSLVPFAKDIVSIFKGYDVERMDMALFSDLKKAMDAFDSDSKTEYEKWSGLIGAISAFFGVPIKNVERDVRALINTFFGENEKTTVTGMVIAIKEGWTGKEISNGQHLYEAMLKGDSAHIKRVEGRFESQKDIEAAIRKAIRENDSRIQQATMAMMTGFANERVRIQKEIIAEGHFRQAYVVEATNAEIDYVRSKIDEAKKYIKKGKNSEAKKIYNSLRERGYSTEFLDKLIK